LRWRAEHARARIAKTTLITLLIGGAALVLLPLSTNLEALVTLG
jgi:hypothetical protein